MARTRRVISARTSMVRGAMPHIAWSLVRTMSLAFAIVCLVQIGLSVAWLGLRPGRGSYLLVILQLALVLAFAGLAVYANSQLRQVRREQRERGARRIP